MNQSDPGQGQERNTPRGGDVDWRRQLGELALACAGSFAAEEAQRLLELRRLLATAPAPGLVRGLAVPAEDDLRDLITIGAGASAALALVGPECGYLLSRGAGGQHLASVALPGAEEETSAGGDSLALALVGALALALVDSELGTGAQARPAARASRLN